MRAAAEIDPTSATVTNRRISLISIVITAFQTVTAIPAPSEAFLACPEAAMGAIGNPHGAVGMGRRSGPFRLALLDPGRRNQPQHRGMNMSNYGGHANAAPSKLFLPIVLLAVFVMPISISGTAVAIPAISHDLGDNPAGLQWVINGFNAAFAIATLLWGVLSDRIGYKATFVTGVVIILGASILSAVSNTLPLLDFGRILAGVGGAAIFTGGGALLSNAFSDAKRARAFAFFGTTIGLGVALGPTISGGLVEWIGWRGVFGLFAIVMILSLLASPVVPSIRHERVPGQKAVDFSLLKNKLYLAMVLVPVASAVGYVTVLSYLPVALSAVRGQSAGTAGLYMLWMTVPVLIGPMLASALISRFKAIGPMTMINIALVSMVLGDVGLLLLSPDNSVWALVIPMILLGFGFGFPIGLLDGEALAAVPARSSGTAAGVLNFMRLGSEAIVVGAYAAVLAALLRADIPDAAAARATAAGLPGHALQYASAFHLIVAVMAVVTALLVVVINVLHRSHRNGTADTLPFEEALELRVDPLA
ncbi:MFS transporter [Microbispora bryophytorum]|uniref:MFS transporter n=1 Tax=Microbispora bryophytorum TaxID=1460882 RepID=UPI0033D4F2C5